MFSLSELLKGWMSDLSVTRSSDCSHGGNWIFCVLDLHPLLVSLYFNPVDLSGLWAAAEAWPSSRSSYGQLLSSSLAWSSWREWRQRCSWGHGLYIGRVRDREVTTGMCWPRNFFRAENYLWKSFFNFMGIFPFLPSKADIESDVEKQRRYQRSLVWSGKHAEWKSGL